MALCNLTNAWTASPISKNFQPMIQGIILFTAKHRNFICLYYKGKEGLPGRPVIEIVNLPGIDFDHDFDTKPERPLFENKIAPARERI